MWGNEEFINGGLDLGMPGSAYYGIFGDFWGDNLIPYIDNGTVAESRVDDAVRNILLLVCKHKAHACTLRLSAS